MKYRKQTQHIRRYRSGRWTAVNKWIKYKNLVQIGKDCVFCGRPVYSQGEERCAYCEATSIYNHLHPKVQKALREYLK